MDYVAGASEAKTSEAQLQAFAGGGSGLGDLAVAVKRKKFCGSGQAGWESLLARGSGARASLW